MSMSFSATMIPWIDLQEKWNQFSRGKNTFDELWADEFTFHDLLDESFERYCWESGYSHSYSFVFHSFTTYRLDHHAVTPYYEQFCLNITKFLCEGSPDIFDLPDPKLKMLDVIYALYSPQTVKSICDDWQQIDWDSIRAVYESAKRGDYDFMTSKAIVEDWVNLFRIASSKDFGVITRLA